MAEVEAQTLRRHQGPGLPNVVSQHGAQAGVEQVGAAVVAGGVPAAGGVDLSRYRLPQGDIALLYNPPMHDEPGHGTVGIMHAYDPVGSGDGSPVAHLAATLGVHGRRLQNYL